MVPILKSGRSFNLSLKKKNIESLLLKWYSCIHRSYKIENQLQDGSTVENSILLWFSIYHPLKCTVLLKSFILLVGSLARKSWTLLRFSLNSVSLLAKLGTNAIIIILQLKINYTSTLAAFVIKFIKITHCITMALPIYLTQLCISIWKWDVYPNFIFIMTV